MGSDPKNVAWLLSLLLLLLNHVAPGLAATSPGSLTGGCVPSGSYEPDRDYFDTPAQIVPDFSDGGTANVVVAQDFQVQYANNFKVLRNTMNNETTVLVLCGTPAPNAELFPDGTHFIEVPVEAYASTSTVQVGFLEVLGMLGRAKYMPTFVTSACAQKLVLSCGVEILDFYDGSQEFENATAVFLDRPDPSDPRSVTFDASTDPGPLNRAEWIVFLGTFFNLDRYASEIFLEIEDSYRRTKADAESTSTTPLVAWISYRGDFGEEFPEAFIVDFAEYKMDLVQDAGARNLDKNADTFSNAVDAGGDMEFRISDFEDRNDASQALANAIREVDVVIDEAFPSDGDYSGYDMDSFYDMYGLSPDNSELRFLATGSVWRNDKRIGAPNAKRQEQGNDWFESALSRPDIVLRDMLFMSEPDLLPDNYQTTYFRNIARGEEVILITADQCQNTCDELFNQAPSADNSASVVFLNGLLLSMLPVLSAFLVLY